MGVGHGWYARMLPGTTLSGKISNNLFYYCFKEGSYISGHSLTAGRRGGLVVTLEYY